MSYWSNLWNAFGGAGNRQDGVQNSAPPTNDDIAVPVTLDSALQISAFWACTRLIAESIGSLPIIIYDVADDGTKTVNKKHKLNMLFSGKVNAWQTRQEYFECIVYQLAVLGNDYSLIVRDSHNNIVSLMPMMSQQMSVELSGYNIKYKYKSENKVRSFLNTEVWHNKLFGNGVVGLSVLDYAKKTVAIASATETVVSKIYKNGGKPSGILTIDKVLTPDQRTKVRENFNDLTSGQDSRLFVLEAGLKYDQVSLSPQDIELLSSRRFNIEDIARFFGVPSVLINDTSASTTWGSGIGEIIQGFYKFGLRPFATRYESSMETRLLSSNERGKIAIRFDFSALLLPSRAERIKANKEGVQGGIITPNEARADEGMKPKSGGDSLYMQQQMAPIETLPVQNPIVSKGDSDNEDK